MPPNVNSKNPNRKLKKLPDDPSPPMGRCVQITIPDDDEWYAMFLGAVHRLGLWVYYDRDENRTARTVARRWQEAFNTITSCQSKAFKSCPDLPDGVSIDSDGNLTIEGECMGDIIINNCCCGSGSTSNVVQGSGTGSSGAIIPGQTGGVVSPTANTASQCDIATEVVPYVIAQMKEYLEAVDVAITAGGNIIDSLVGVATDAIDPTDISANVIEDLKEIAAAGLDPVINALGDTDLIQQSQVNWWGRVPSGVRYEAMTRDDILNIGRSLPVAWGSIPLGTFTSPRIWGESLGRVINVNKVNRQVVLAKGDADENLCAFLASENGQDFSAAPTVSPPLPFVSLATGSGNTWYQIVAPESPVVFTSSAPLQADFGSRVLAMAGLYQRNINPTNQDGARVTTISMDGVAAYSAGDAQFGQPVEFKSLVEPQYESDVSELETFLGLSSVPAAPNFAAQDTDATFGSVWSMEVQASARSVTIEELWILMVEQ